MALTLLHSVFGLCAVSSSSNLRQRTTASKHRFTPIKSVTSTSTHHPSKGTVRRRRKYNDVNGATVAKVVENPYLKLETAGPELEKSLSDFLEEARGFVGDREGGIPRWFSPLECGAQATGSPLLLFLPGIDGTGLGLIRHHKKLGEIFDIWCLHIPVSDRTSLQDLVKLIENTVKSEYYRFTNRPIYLVGESIGACLALDVAARNPNIDLALILVNPATHVNNFMSQPLSGMLSVLPDGIPTLLEEVFGDPLTGMLGALSNEFAVPQMSGGMLRDIFAVSSNLPTLSRMFPKETLLWKLELLKSAIASVNSHIYSVRAESLILLSGRDQWLFKEEDINRYSRTLPKCLVRKAHANGQFLLFEDGIDLATILKCTSFYRRGKSHDHITDYIMPTRFELKQQLDDHRYLMEGASPVMLSTLEDGTLVRGLEGLPSEGPVLYVGYHMLLGFELGPLVIQLMRERNIHVRGLAHPLLFNHEQDLVDPQVFDKYKILGGVPVSNFNIYKLLREKSHVQWRRLSLDPPLLVFLYPGGVREALHRKGEEYKLFWPEQSEFVIVASKFGAKIIPFGVVGEDDICEICCLAYKQEAEAVLSLYSNPDKLYIYSTLYSPDSRFRVTLAWTLDDSQIILDSNDQKNIPILKDLMEYATKEASNVREGDESELGKQDCYIPGLLPKIPGRFYFYFGKPIDLAGRERELKDKEKAQEVYLQVKSEVEQCVAYLKMKRESDPYRNLLPRMIYQASHGWSSEIPTFDL